MTDITNLAIEELWRRVRENGNVQKIVADDLGITPSYLSEILNNKRPLTDHILEKIGFTFVRVPVKNEEVPQVVRAIENALEVKKGVDRLSKRIMPKIREASRP